MKKNLSFYLTGILIVAIVSLASAQSSLTHSFSFKNGDPIDDITGETGELMGEAYIDGSDLIIPDNASYMDLSGVGIEINAYEALTLEIWVTSEAGANTGYTMLCYLGGTTGGLGTQGCFISAARGDDVSRGAISTVSLTAPYGGNESGVNGPEFDDGELHYYVLTIDEDIVKYYVDGEFLGEAELATIGNSIAGLSNDFAYIGKGGYTADPCWIGTIHKFNIYKGVLSDAEVMELTAEPNGTKVAQLNNNFKPSIYATQNQVHISLANSLSADGKAEIFTVSGQKIAEVSINNKASIALENGMYIVKVTAKNNVYSQKINVHNN